MNTLINRCWHVNEKGELDCWNEREYACFHCKHVMCKKHTRERVIDGYAQTFCEACFDASNVSTLHKRE